MLEAIPAFLYVNQPWYVILIEIWVTFTFISRLKYFILSKIYKAHSPPRRGDWFFGFHLLYDMLREGLRGTAQEFTRLNMKKLNVHTAFFKLVGKDIILTHDPENIKAILATQFNDFILGSRHECVKITLGDGIFTLDGTGWKHSRAMLRPQFAREQIGHVESLEPRVQALIAQIRKTKGTVFDIQPLFFKLTVDSGTDFLFGESCDSLNEGLNREMDPSFEGVDSELRRKFPDAFNYSQNILNIRLNLQKLYWLGSTLKFKKCNKIVHDFTDFYVKKALGASEKELETNSRGGYVFLYELLKETRDPVVLRDQCLNILLAARDTTAGLLSFTLFELARNPQIFATLRQNIVDAFGEGIEADISLISFESLKKCEYLKWVLNEALRMYPSVPRNFRVSTRNTTLPRGGGPDQSSPIFVEKGTVVTYAVYSTHRDEQFYGEDAHVFRPERWGEPATKKLGWAFLPFNGGPRICLGQQFALTEASYVIVRLLQTFSVVEAFDTVYPPKLQTHLTMSLKEGANIALH